MIMAYLINTQFLQVLFHKLNGDKISTSSQILHFDIVKYLTSYGQPTGFCHNTLMPCRPAKNGRSIDQVRSELDIDRTNPWIAGHHVRSFTYSFTRSQKFHYLIIKRDNICFRKEKIRNVKLGKLVVEKFQVLANFHDVIKSCQDRKSSCLPLFHLL